MAAARDFSRATLNGDCRRIIQRNGKSALQVAADETCARSREEKNIAERERNENNKRKKNVHNKSVKQKYKKKEREGGRDR